MRTRKRFGQHFLEPVWADKVAAAIAPGSSDEFLEIGAGPGILTLRLAARALRVVAIEIDRDLVAQLGPRLPPNVSLVAGDVLRLDLESLTSPTQVTRVAGNLPYNISSPVLLRLLRLAERRPIADATLMLQEEVADRVAAAPGSKDYGALSVLAQWRAEVATLLTLPPGAFRPPPRVRSALVRLTFRSVRTPVADPTLFEQLVRQMFLQRRKTLANALAPFAASLRVQAAPALTSAGIDHRRRPETLDIVEIARLADAFSAAAR